MSASSTRHWRLLLDDGATASGGLAMDETLARRTGLGECPPTLRLYTYRSHCALVGRFQDVDAEVHRDECRELDVAINRRPTGGGTILMGEEQLGVALTVPGRQEGFGGRARELMPLFSAGFVEGLRTLGMEARFRGKNDVDVDGRKIAGLGIHRDESGALLFHGSLLVNLDVPLMLRVLKSPFRRITDRERRLVENRTSTVWKETGTTVSVDDVRSAIQEGFRSSFDVELERGELSPREVRDASSLEESKYGSEEWLRESGGVLDRTGSARVRTPGGTLEVFATLTGTTIKALHIRGDFLDAENAVADLEGSLRWHPLDAEAIRRTVHEVHDRRFELSTLSREELSEAIVAATSRPDPHGCFVSPGSAG